MVTGAATDVVTVEAAASRICAKARASSGLSTARCIASTKMVHSISSRTAPD